MPRKNQSSAQPFDLDERLPGWVENPEYVDEHEIRRFAVLGGVKTVLNRRYPDGWGDEQVRAYIIERRRQRIEITLIRYRNLDTERKNVEQLVEGKVKEYLAHFRDPTPNDLVSLREMARISLTLDMLAEKQEAMILDARIDQKEISSRDFESISKVRADSMRAFAALEKQLGIDRQSRESESDTLTLLQETRAEAARLLASRKRDITCAACEAKGELFNLGFIVFHFEQNGLAYEFACQCPRCGGVARLVMGSLAPQKVIDEARPQD